MDQSRPIWTNLDQSDQPGPSGTNLDQSVPSVTNQANLESGPICDNLDQSWPIWTGPIWTKVGRCWWIYLYFSIFGRGTHFQVPRYIIIEENDAFCVKWGLIESPIQQFGPHEDQLLNWGPLCFAVRTRCGPFEQFGPHAVLAKTESCFADLRSKAFKFKKETFRVKCGLFPNLF